MQKALWGKELEKWAFNEWGKRIIMQVFDKRAYDSSNQPAKGLNGPFAQQNRSRPANRDTPNMQI